MDEKEQDGLIKQFARISTTIRRIFASVLFN